MTRPELPAVVLRRRAVVYVRQSTAAQVSDNLESQHRQYALVELAHSFGFGEVDLIDDDLGRSASGVVERLLELCGLVGARVIDTDGVYDPCRPNDRLLLGMKGTISEFELGILRTRMTEALWGKAERGELRIPVPIGFVWEPEGEVAFDPDLRIQEAVRTIFLKFQELGSGRQVLLWMSGEGLHFPRPSDGKNSTSFEWHGVRYRNVISVLKNPFYAGVYAYGKSQNRTELVDGRPRKTYGHQLPMAEWRVFLKGHHEGYITWEEFERNQEQLARNAYGKRGGAAKSGRGGRALLSGMLRCRRCGHVLSVIYTGRYPAPKYRCGHLRGAYGAGWCIQFAAWPVERVVTAELLRAVQPMAVEAAMEAERRLAKQQDDAQRLRELELEQARYEARLAERRYAACDPDNRLVASQLEANWEACMQRIRELEEQLRTAPRQELPSPSRRSLEGLAGDLQAAWDAPTTTMRTRQRIVRTLIEEIIVDVDDDTSEILLTIHWKGGQHSQIRTRKPRSGEHGRRASEETVEIVRSMAGRWSDEHIAATLNRMGLRTGQGNTWDQIRVQALRNTHDIPAYRSAHKGGPWITMSEAAARLGVTNHVIRWLIRSGVLPAEQVVPRAPYQIRLTDLEREEVAQALVSRSQRRPCRKDLDKQTLRIPGT